jgi:hypothetical protein
MNNQGSMCKVQHRRCIAGSRTHTIALTCQTDLHTKYEEMNINVRIPLNEQEQRAILMLLLEMKKPMWTGGQQIMLLKASNL